MLSDEVVDAVGSIVAIDVAEEVDDVTADITALMEVALAEGFDEAAVPDTDFPDVDLAVLVRVTLGFVGIVDLSEGANSLFARPCRWPLEGTSCPTEGRVGQIEVTLRKNGRGWSPSPALGRLSGTSDV